MGGAIHSGVGGRLGRRPGRSGSNRRIMGEINITPFVDVMLVLLVIFMVAAPLMTAGVQVELPKTESSAPAPPNTASLHALPPACHCSPAPKSNHTAPAHAPSACNPTTPAPDHPSTPPSCGSVSQKCRASKPRFVNCCQSITMSSLTDAILRD